MKIDHSGDIPALTRLDPAPRGGDGEPSTLTSSEARRAASLLDEILAADPETSVHRPVRARTSGRGPRSRRWLLAPLVAVATGAAVVVPILTTGGDKAYASWSPSPVVLSAADGAVAAQACLANLGQVADAQVTPMLAERRGEWTYVLVRPTAKTESSCIMPTAEIRESPGGDRRRWFASTNEELSDPVRNPREVRVDTAATGSTKEGLFSYSEGAVGREVVDITFTTPRGVTVKASVGNGRYAAWWPAGSNNLRNPEISRAPDIDVSLSDGTTFRLPR